jgi:hypothetical protein
MLLLNPCQKKNQNELEEGLYDVLHIQHFVYIREMVCEDETRENKF